MPAKVYIGSTERFFKLRWYEHETSFKHRKENSTTLSTYVWKLKDRGLTPKFKWSIKAKAHTYEAGSTLCDLCLTEKYFIMYEHTDDSLNSRDELLYRCRHMKDFLLSQCP